jgi:hypothetical protein
VCETVGVELELGALDDVSYVATADVSELVNPVAQHAANNGCIGFPSENASSTTRSFKPPSNFSAVMDAVARFNMGQPSTGPLCPRNPLKRPRPKAAATAIHRTFTLRDVLSSDSSYDYEQEDCDDLDKSISVCTISQPLADERTRSRRLQERGVVYNLGAWFKCPTVQLA